MIQNSEDMRKIQNMFNSNKAVKMTLNILSTDKTLDNELLIRLFE